VPGLARVLNVPRVTPVDIAHVGILEIAKAKRHLKKNGLEFAGRGYSSSIDQRRG